MDTSLEHSLKENPPKQTKKRQLKRDDSSEANKDVVENLQEEGISSTETKESRASTPRKKPRHLLYREPPNLPSLDTDIFKTPYDSNLPSLDLGSSLDTSSVTYSTDSDNLGSLGENIQKYSLDSLKEFSLPPEPDESYSHASPPVNYSSLSTTLSYHEQQLSYSSSKQHTVTNTEKLQSIVCLDSFASNQSKVDSKHRKSIQGNFDDIGNQYNMNTSLLSFDSNFNEQNLKSNQNDSRNLNIKNCELNSDHSDFYAPSDLQVKFLPREIQHVDSITFLSCAAELVVQISVNSTSGARGQGDEYSKYIGTNRVRNGTGFIGAVDEQIMKFRCKIKDCKHALPSKIVSSSVDQNSSLCSNSSFDFGSSSPNTSSTVSCASPVSPGNKKKNAEKHFFYSGVTVHTSRHVIFDKSEADNAQVKFFFNSLDGRGVVQGHVAAIVGVNILQDHVTLHVMSHDKNLFNTVGIVLQNMKSSYKQMLKSTTKAQQAHSLKHKEDKSWVALISHPHGLSKYVTLGRVRKEVVDGIRVKKFYDAPACEGSSGGLVMTPSLLKLQFPGAVHSTFDVNTGLNFTLDSRFYNLPH